MLLQLHIMAGMVGAFRFAPSSVCSSSQIPFNNVWTSRDLSVFSFAFRFMSAITTNSILHIVNHVCFVKCVNIATLIPYISAHQIITTCVIFAVKNISAVLLHYMYVPFAFGNCTSAQVTPMFFACAGCFFSAKFVHVNPLFLCFCNDFLSFQTHLPPSAIPRRCRAPVLRR